MTVRPPILNEPYTNLTIFPAESLVTSSLHARRSHSRTAIVSVENKSSAPSSKPNKAAPASSKSKQHWVPTDNQHIPLVMQNASQHATPSPSFLPPPASSSRQPNRDPLPQSLIPVHPAQPEPMNDSSAKQFMSGSTIEEGLHLVQSELPFSHAMPSTTNGAIDASIESLQPAGAITQTSHGPFTNHASKISEKDKDWCMDPQEMDRASSLHSLKVFQEDILSSEIIWCFACFIA